MRVWRWPLRESGCAPTFSVIARLLPTLNIPGRILFGTEDRLLPDIADTVARLREDLPQAVITRLPDCGHLVQENAPAQVGALLGQFFAVER